MLGAAEADYLESPYKKVGNDFVDHLALGRRWVVGRKEMVINNPTINVF